MEQNIESAYIFIVMYPTTGFSRHFHLLAMSYLISDWILVGFGSSYGGG